MAWLPEQTASRLDDIAAEMRALVAESTRIWRNAGPAERAILEAHPTWADMPLDDFATASTALAAQMWAAIEAKQTEAA
jgi:hypothetical protein